MNSWEERDAQIGPLLKQIITRVRRNHTMFVQLSPHRDLNIQKIELLNHIVEFWFYLVGGSIFFNVTDVLEFGHSFAENLKNGPTCHYYKTHKMELT